MFLICVHTDLVLYFHYALLGLDILGEVTLTRWCDCTKRPCYTLKHVPYFDCPDSQPDKEPANSDLSVVDNFLQHTLES
jgi:hypothetical protein